MCRLNKSIKWRKYVYNWKKGNFFLLKYLVFVWQKKKQKNLYIKKLKTFRHRKNDRIMWIILFIYVIIITITTLRVVIYWKKYHQNESNHSWPLYYFSRYAYTVNNEIGQTWTCKKNIHIVLGIVINLVSEVAMNMSS